MAKRTPYELRVKRHQRLRKRVMGNAERPRLSVFRSNTHIYAQVIDDNLGATMVAASTVEPTVRSQIDGQNRTAQAEVVGKLVAERALNSGITKIVFDRGGFKFHGRVKALAEAARKAGLSF
jgi:large subunit ribosomal protein L18